MGNAEASVHGTRAMPGWRRWEPLSGFAFIVLFAGSVVASNVPANSASDKAWVAAYTGHGNQIGHVATGICLVLAGLCLLAFLTTVWTRVAAAGRPDAIHPLPLVAAGVSAACIAAGGIFMAAISATALGNSAPVPGADLLRFANDMGFGLVGIAGMVAAALSVACVSVQARSAGLFGRALMIFSLVVAVVLLASILFIPIVALFIWVIVVAITLMRSSSHPISASSPGRQQIEPA